MILGVDRILDMCSPVLNMAGDQAPPSASDASGTPAQASMPEVPPAGRRQPGLSAGCGPLLFLAVAGWVGFQWFTWPDVEALATWNPTSTAFIDRYHKRVAEADQREEADWRWVPYGAISAHLKRAVLVAEDIQFFSHHGFATSEISSAIQEAARERTAPRGASTITQQLAKNLWLSPSRNPVRKLKEAVLTAQLEKHLAKHRILELYLNVVEFGRGIYGAEAAAQRYFGKPASRLTEHEAALLAASLPRPSTWHPGSKTEAYLRRAARIERLMMRATYLRRRF